MSSMVDERNMSMEQWWNDTARRKLKSSERKKRLPLSHTNASWTEHKSDLGSAMRGRRPEPWYCPQRFNEDTFKLKLYIIFISLRRETTDSSSSCGTVHRTLGNKAREDIQLKFYEVMSTPAVLYGCESWAKRQRNELDLWAAKSERLYWIEYRNKDVLVSVLNSEMNYKY